MSGGGKIPDAPDLSGNVKNADASYGTATSNAAQTMNTAQSYNDAAQKNLSGVTAATNSMAGQIGANANQNLQTYGSTFVPLQQQEAQAASDYGSEANVARLQGQAVANVNSANQAARSNSAAALAREGVDPGSVHGAALDRQQSVMGAAQAANAGTQSAINTQQQAFGMQNTANQLGTQVGQMGTNAAAQSAGVSQAGQQGVNATNASGVNNLTAANSYLNTGVNANKSSSDIATQGFGNQMQQYNAQQAQSAGLMSSIGSIAGAAAMFMEEGGPVPAGRGIPTNAMATNMATGGAVTSRGALPVSPIPGSTDTKPAILTPGEFVVPKDVVDHLGAEHFHKLIDKTRQQANTRRAIPVNHSPHVSMH
jgi:hypothetical protein